MTIHRSYFYYIEKRDDSDVADAIKDTAEFGDGFWKIFQRLRNQGKPWNHRKVYRVYKSMCYNKRVRLRKRLPARVKESLSIPDGPNQTWNMDFVSDALNSGRKFIVLNILDDFNRETVAQEISMSMPADRVIRIVEQIIWSNGKPAAIRCDNGLEFISHKFQEWCTANQIAIKYTQPGCPTQNSYIERFNGSYRRGVLDASIFRTLGDVREQTERWMQDYNQSRPHDSLGGATQRLQKKL